MPNPTTDQKIEALESKMNDRMQALAEENLRLKRSARRYVRWSMIFVGVACFGALSYAWAIDPLAAGDVKTDFQPNGVISAGEFNTNFTNLMNKTNELVTDVDANTDKVTLGGTYSVNATFKGVTTNFFDGAGVGGYAGAKTKCESLLSSPTAHMCTVEELVRSVATGVSFPAGGHWYAGDRGEAGGLTINDCDSYTSNNASMRGPHVTDGRIHDSGTCEVPNQIACCD